MKIALGARWRPARRSRTRLCYGTESKPGCSTRPATNSRFCISATTSQSSGEHAEMGCVGWRWETFPSRPWWSCRKAPDRSSSRGWWWSKTRMALRQSASTLPTARPISSARTSMSAPAGAPSIPRKSRPRSTARPQEPGREGNMLILEPNLSHPDDFYEALIESHRGLSVEQSGMLNAKLILLLANQVGDLDVLRAAIAKAREGIEPAGEDATLKAVA